jgi:hypothetical protein
VTYETWTASVHQIVGFNNTAHTVTFSNPFDEQVARSLAFISSSPRSRRPTTLLLLTKTPPCPSLLPSPLPRPWTVPHTQWASASGRRFYFENMFEALDQAGEFYVDVPARMLYWRSPGGSPNEMSMVISQAPVLLHVQGDLVAGTSVEYLNFVNLTFAHAEISYASCYASSCNGQSGDFLSDAAIILEAAKEILFQRVTVTHVGSYGVWFAQGTFNNTLSLSHVYDVGAGAVRLGVGNAGPTPGYHSEGNSVLDCVLEDGGHVIMEGCGVLAQQVRGGGVADVQVAWTVVAHNIITNFKFVHLTPSSCTPPSLPPAVSSSPILPHSASLTHATLTHQVHGCVAGLDLGLRGHRGPRELHRL